jgi:predicted MFS family arabinose efflux permease
VRLSRATRRVYYGWWIVLGFVVLNVYWFGTLGVGLTVLFTPIRHTFGWSAALLAGVLSLGSVATGLCAPLVGIIFDRSGPRGILLLATACAALGMVLVARATGLASFVAPFVLVAIGLGIWASGTGPAAAGLWFDRRRGLAMGIIIGGSSIGGLLVPVWKLLVDAAGWRVTLVVAAVALCVVSVPCCLIMRHRPSDLGLLPDGDAAKEGNRSEGVALVTGDATLFDALASWQFWLLSLAAALLIAGSSAATLLMLPRLQDARLNSGVAVTAITLVTLLGALGKPGCGWLADRLDAERLAALSAALQTVGLLAFALAPEQLPLLALFVLAFGLGQDNARIMLALICTRYFGLRAFGRIQGVLYLTLVVGRVGGPVLAGRLHDAGHGYGSGFLIFAALSLLAVPALLALRPPKHARFPAASA